MANPDAYIPALRFGWLTKAYDAVVGATMPEKQFKAALVNQATIGPGYRVLDFGCGTATLTLLVKQQHPDAVVTGVDVDAEVLTIARRKAGWVSADVSLDGYQGTRLPYEAGCFDRVVSSLVFHHLTGEQKRNALEEIHRVLKPGGELHLADWEKPGTVG